MRHTRGQPLYHQRSPQLCFNHYSLVTRSIAQSNNVTMSAQLEIGISSLSSFATPRKVSLSTLRFPLKNPSHCVPSISSYLHAQNQSDECSKAVATSMAAAQSGIHYCDQAKSIAGRLDFIDENQRQESLKQIQELTGRGVTEAGQTHSSLKVALHRVQQVLILHWSLSYKYSI